MLNENKNIDRLFLAKLGDYQKTPQLFVWTNIQEKLNSQRKKRLIILLKTVGIAAAIIVAFLSGWWMTNPSEKSSLLQNRIAVQNNLIREVDPSSIKRLETTQKLSVNTDQVVSNTSELSPKAYKKPTLKLSSLATFAPGTSFIHKTDPSIAQKPGDLVLSDSEKSLIDELHPNSKMVKKFTDWIAAIKKDSTAIKKDSVAITKSNSNVLFNDPFKRSVSESSVAIAFNRPVKGNGRWSLKAEITPVINNQEQNNGSSNLLSSTPNYKPQKTSADNTISGGLVAGYKISKRLVVKSGFIYNNIRQTTHNVDFSEANSLYYATGGATLASTPSGFVNLNRTLGNTQSDLISGSPVSSSYTKYSAANDLKQEIRFIEIPVHVTYKLIDKKLNVGLTGGISTNILVGNKAILSDKGESISSGETTNMRNIVYSGAVGLEIGYELTDRITLTVEPRLKHFISSLSTNKSVNYKPSQMGIVTGLTYSFN